MQHPAGAQPVSDHCDVGRLQQSAFVVTGFRPRVGEEHPHTTQRARSQQQIQHVDGVAADQPDIGDVFPVDGGEQLRQPAPVNLDRDDVDVWLGLRHRDRGSARATTDFEDKRSVAAKPGVGVQRF